jgi:hypothetical protein
MIKRLGVLLPVLAGVMVTGPTAHAAAAGIPFTATFSGAAALTSPSTSSFVGAGLATQLGQVTTAGHVLITGYDDSRCAGGIANTNVETLTAPDGDTVTVTSDDVACPISPGQYHGFGRWTVTGGTGRFEDASGGGSFDGHSDFNLGTFDTRLDGTLVLGIPFQARVAGTATLTGATTGTFSGTGLATLMGSISNLGGVLAAPDQPSDSCPNGFHSVNTETFTAADGATLSVRSDDVTCPVGPGRYQGIGHWTVIAGAGRFAGASGQGSYQGLADFAARSFTFTFTGKVVL